MRRFVILFLLIAVILAVDPLNIFTQQARAADAASASDWPPPGTIKFERGLGYYFSLWKLILLWLTFLGWVKLTDWLGQDTVIYKKNYALWNPVLVFPFVVTFILFWFLPSFWVGYPLILLSIIIPPIIYAKNRNEGMLDGEKIFTKMHFRHVFANLGKGVGVKINTQKVEAHDMGANVKFVPKGGDDQTNQANLITSRQSPGWVPTKDIIADVIERRADQLVIDITATGAIVRVAIDGNLNPHSQKTRGEVDPIVTVLKKLGNLNEKDRRNRQESKFDVEYKGQKLVAKIVTQGTESGERTVITLTNPKKVFKTFGELGMRDKLVPLVKEKLGTHQGMILTSAPPGAGFTTAYTVTLKECDRYMRDFVAVEEKSKREPDVENVHVAEFDARAGQNPISFINELSLKYPNAYAMSDMVNAETVEALIQQIHEVEEGRLVIGGIKARECAEALLRVLMMKVPPARLAPEVLMVINMRLVRKLCETCKESYTPSGDTLRRLGLTPAQVPQLYRPRTLNPADKKQLPCETCRDLGYLGRTGIFEVLFVGDNVRHALVNTPQLDAVRTAARKDGMRTLQEEGILLVAKGVTSLDELMKALKPG